MIRAVLSLTFFFVFALKGEIVVVGHPELPIKTLKNSDIPHLFLGKNPRFPDGSRAIPIEYSKSGQKAYFYQKVLGKTLSQLKAYWASLMFTGKGRPPKQLSNVNAVLGYIAANPDAVSYLKSDEIDNRVKILYRIK